VVNFGRRFHPEPGQNCTPVHSGGTSLAQFGYTYNADDNVKTLTVSSPSAQTTTYGYDTANRMITALIGTGSPQYVYGYDHASNLTSITPDGPAESFSYTSTNALTIGTYDANGSPKALSGSSYKWDGANRLVRFANSANNTGSSFTYDGLGRLVRVVDTHGGSITADHSYTWCGAVRCLAHDNTQSGSPVSTQYFDQGAIISGISYYYVKDQLGSVTQLISSTGSVTSQYTYDPYGNRTQVSGTLVSDIGYAGYFYHAASGLEFALYRAYDPNHARWLNRDPFGENGGVNLYGYVEGNPINLVDPSGLFNKYALEVAERLAVGEEVAGGGPVDPIADAAALLTLGIGAIVAELSSSPTPVAGSNGAGSKQPPAATAQAGEPCDGHHPYPQFLGGPKNQDLANMSRSDHQQLHRDLTEFLKSYTDDFGNTMSPSRYNSGATIRQNFSPADRWGAMNDFYSDGPGAEFPGAAQSFYRQFPTSP
jgi:RHS repeat-associated protein